MKKIIFLSVLISFLFSCKKDEITIDPEEPIVTEDTVSVYLANKLYELQDVRYGNDTQHVLDVYLPANRTKETKVFVLIHGGGWQSGSKDDYRYFYDALKQFYPECAIINIGYRLATVDNPGYPKQIEDIGAALKFMQHPNFIISNDYFLFGASAGGHLAMLYSYGFDVLKEVKGICNTVGPADFTDPSYTENSAFDYGLLNFVGNYTYAQKPELYKEVSPAWRVTANSPPTISFYGDSDPLVPATQIDRLHDKLDEFGVYNDKTLYPGEGHGGWNDAHNQHYQNKIVQFLQEVFL